MSHTSENRLFFYARDPPFISYFYTYTQTHRSNITLKTHTYIDKFVFLNIELQKQNMAHFFETWPDLHETQLSVFRDQTNSPYRDYKSGRVHFAKGLHAKGLPGYVCVYLIVFGVVCVLSWLPIKEKLGKINRTVSGQET